jgi:hypothetical protein
VGSVKKEIKMVENSVNLNPKKYQYGTKTKFNKACFEARKMREWIKWYNENRRWDEKAIIIRNE